MIGTAVYYKHYKNGHQSYKYTALFNRSGKKKRHRVTVPVRFYMEEGPSNASSKGKEGQFRYVAFPTQWKTTLCKVVQQKMQLMVVAMMELIRVIKSM